MKCDFNWCVYNKDKKCLLEEISINVFGVCDDAVSVSIPEEKMNSYKETQLSNNVKYMMQQIKN